MISSSNLESLVGKTVRGESGHKIGKVADVYESTEGADGTFITVSTGLFGGHDSFVPLTRAEVQGADVVVPYDKELVKDAPRIAADEELSDEEEDRLYAHYSLPFTDATRSAATYDSPDDRDARDRGAHDSRTAGRTLDDDAMTRSEERLTVGTERVETGRARLRKRIVTEQVSQTVTVHHDQVRVVREPVTGTVPGLELSEQEQEVVLRAESVVVSKQTVPVERVRLDTEVVREQQTVTEQVRKEQIDTDLDVPHGSQHGGER